MVKSAFNAIVSMDLSTNFPINEKFEIDTTYRLEDSFGIMVNYAFSQSIRIGYTYDHIVTDLKRNTPSSHEFIPFFDANFTKKTYQSPRFL